MTDRRKAGEQALEALRGYRREMQEHQPCDAEVALEAALAQPEQEPVAWRYKPMVGSPWSMSDDGYYISCKRDKGYTVEPLYARPLGPHPDTVRLAYLYSGTQTSSDALVNAEMKLLNGKTLTLEEARAAIDDAMSKPMKY